MKKLLVLLTISINLSVAARLPAENTAASKTNYKEISLEEASKLALSNSLIIQLAKYDLYIKRQSLNRSLSIFDTYLSALGSYKIDELEQSTTFFGSKTTENIYSLNLDKKLPTGTRIGLSALDFRSDTNSVFVPVSPLHEASAGVSLTQSLGRNFFGISDRAITTITKKDIENTEYTSLDTIEQNLADVQAAYWHFILKSEELLIKEDVLNEAKKLHSIHKNKFQLGLVEKADLLASKANIYMRKNDVEGALLEKEKAKNHLLYLLNEDSTSVELKGTDDLETEPKTADMYKALNEAQSSRRDYKSVKKLLDMNSIDIVAKKNALWPVIDLTASFKKNGINRKFSDSWNDVADENNTEFYVGTSFSMPLGNRNSRAEYAESKLKKEQLLIQLKRIERLILLNINDAVAQVNTLKNQVDISRELVDIQSRKLKEEYNRFKLGRSQSDILIRSEEDILRARLMFAGSLFQYRTSLVNLERSKNTLLDKYWKEKL